MTRASDIGAALIESRRSQAITQRELARRMGVLQPQIARWERTAYANASLEHVVGVADALGMAPVVAGAFRAAESPAVYGAVASPAHPIDGFDLAERLGLGGDALGAFAREHAILEIGVFGSVLRADYSPASDMDFLVRYAPEKHHTLESMELEEAALAALVGRPVDIITRASVERMDNPVRRRHILGSVRTVYVA
jgi:predicted nucleotidyltransferase/DNA-binding XRE family transcriptional regulator